MAERVEIEPIAHIRTDFPSKFGIPRQSGVVESLRGRIVFEPSYRNTDYIRGIEKYTHLWLIWLFSANKHQPNSPLVRPPRLGGNTHVGVFATRSPYRPNPIGLSAVRIEKIDYDTPEGPVISVRGADLMDGTPIIDIKPYITYADSIPDARSGFVDEVEFSHLDVVLPDQFRSAIGDEMANTLIGVLQNDPRPPVQATADKTFGMPFAGFDVRFRVDGTTLTVVDLVKL
ncbi:MAG: tRNA (N6-threonylcarbamoyladenosine(37)-N6)-methyltransferase TrmO [Salinivirgaceae bacterium]|nr:tRNA (N6-threonylcarbamoyladenosine(37)-N6)-methyltransferase TrmO [Salinivirgaceae bacterium]